MQSNLLSKPLAIAACLTLVGAAALAEGAVIVDSHAVSANDQSSIPGYTTTSSTDLLLVGYGGYNKDTIGVTGVTFGGTALTELPGSRAEDPDDNQIQTVFYYLLAPGDATGDIAVTVSPGDPWFDGAVAYNISGVSSIGQISAFTAQGDGGDTSISITQTVSGSELALDMLITDDASDGDDFHVAMSGQTEVLNSINSNATNPDKTVGSSYKSLTGGSTTMGWDYGLTMGIDDKGAAYTTLIFVPEPATFGLAAFGLLSLIGSGRRRKR